MASGLFLGLDAFLAAGPGMSSVRRRVDDGREVPLPAAKPSPGRSIRLNPTFATFAVHARARARARARALVLSLSLSLFVCSESPLACSLHSLHYYPSHDHMRASVPAGAFERLPDMIGAGLCCVVLQILGKKVGPHRGRQHQVE